MIDHGTRYMGLGTLKTRSPAHSPCRSLHWSPTLPRIRYPSSSASFLLTADLNATALCPRYAALLQIKETPLCYVTRVVGPEQGRGPAQAHAQLYTTATACVPHDEAVVPGEASGGEIGGRAGAQGLLRTTLPRITRSAPFPPVSSRGARNCTRPVSLPINTTEETHETLDIGLGLRPLSDLYSI
jgi:hypothetical protein